MQRDDLPDWLRRYAGDEHPDATVRGTACRTRRGLHAEWAAALEFPPHFGHNWDALSDSLVERAWPEVVGPRQQVGLTRPLSILIRDADQLLVDEPAPQLATLLAVLDDVATGRTIRDEPSPTARVSVCLQYPQEAHDVLHDRLRSAWAATAGT